MQFKSTYIACLSGLGLALAGSSLLAPNAYALSAGSAELEEVLVTASRREESLQDVAVAMTVLDPMKFADTGKTSLTDILPFVPGVAVTDGGGSFGNNVIVRGINATGAAGVGTYVDDVPYGSTTVYSSGGAPVDGTLLDLQTMEVLKGPQGTLYGASAMGGLLKFTTRNASLEEWSGNLSADLSTTKSGGLNQLYRVTANGPLATDTVGLSFTGFWKDKTGYIDNSLLGIDNWDDYEYYGGSMSLLFVPTEELTVKAQTFYQKSTQNGLATIQANSLDDFPIPGLGAGQPVYGKLESGAADINPSIFESKLFALSADYNFGFATLTSVTSYQELTFNQTADLTVPFAAIADAFFPANAPHTSALFTGSLGFDKFTQEVRLTSESNGKFEWLVGGFYQNEEGFNTQVLDTVPAEPLLFFANFPSEYSETSVFGTANYFFTPDFDASVGVRYTDYTSSVELDTRGSLLVAPVPFNEIDDNVTNYLFNVRYRPTDNTSIYGRAASGFRPGGANFVLLDPVTGAPLTPPAFFSDSLWSYELGVKGNAADGRFGYDVAVFYIDWQDYQVGVNIGGLNVIGNAQEASSKGAEGAVSFAVTDAFALNATASYVDAQLDVDEPTLGGAKGTQLPNSPKWSGTVGFNYDFNLGSIPAYLAGSWRYNGKFAVGFEGAQIGDTFYPSSFPRYTNGSYSQLDLNVGITTERFDASLYVTNLLNEYAYTNFATSYQAFGAAVPLRPQTVGVVLRAKF